MLNSEKAQAVILKQIPLDKTVVERVKQALERKGVTLSQSEDIDKNLISRGREATVYDPGDLILMHTRVSVSGFFEELIHYGQILNGHYNRNSPTDIIKMEIEAQEKLIKHRDAYRIPDEEIALLTENLAHYKMTLVRLEDGGC